jgi:hypothetical protein
MYHHAQLVLLLLFVFLVGLGFELRVSQLHTCKVGALLHQPYLQSTFALIILEMESHEVFAQAGLKPQSS